MSPPTFSHCCDKQIAARVDHFSGTGWSCGLCFDINLSQNLMTKTHSPQILDKVISISDRTYESRVLRGMSEICPICGDVAFFPTRGCLYYLLSLQLPSLWKTAQSTLCDSEDYLHSPPPRAAPVWYPWFCACALILLHLCLYTPVSLDRQTEKGTDCTTCPEGSISF